jgi:hypothetical protein
LNGAQLLEPIYALAFFRKHSTDFAREFLSWQGFLAFHALQALVIS